MSANGQDKKLAEDIDKIRNMNIPEDRKKALIEKLLEDCFPPKNADDIAQILDHLDDYVRYCLGRD